LQHETFTYGEEMTRKTKINKRELAAVLRESVFAPNKPGPLKVIMDVGDSRYYRQRALELITLSWWEAFWSNHYTHWLWIMNPSLAYILCAIVFVLVGMFFTGCWGILSE